jgi:pimeloyl-ACP methyl ester carboxylesterase
MRLIVPDLRGHGRTTNPLNVFTFQQSAWDLFILLDRLGIERVKAVGLSGGAEVLLHMATQQPRRIEAMVLVSGAHYFPASARAIMRDTTVESRTDADWETMRQRHKHGDDQIRSLWRQGNAFKDSYDDVNFTPPYLATIEARTLLVHGDRDPLYPVELALELYSAIPRAHLWVIPNAGHVPIFGALAGQFVDTALSFLRSPADERTEP